MTTFSSWTLEQIRKGGSSMSWMEEKRFEWVPLAASSINRLINAQTFLLITDNDREWFGEYILKRLNKASFDRPLLPILSLASIFPHVDSIKDSEQMALLDDMLSLSFPNGYTYFYIGKGNHPRAKIAKSKDNALKWLFNERAQNSFYMNAEDENLDIKLIQLIALFDKSIDAILFSEVDSEGAL
jgi:hypothetical protein